jgi:hypothetical protein
MSDLFAQTTAIFSVHGYKTVGFSLLYCLIPLLASKRKHYGWCRRVAHSKNDEVWRCDGMREGWLWQLEE